MSNESNNEWANLDLSPGSLDLGRNLFDELTLEDFLQEIQSNIENINGASITAQFEQDLARRVEDARFVFSSNLPEIIRAARAERGRP
jgi:hypothetical protein